MKKVSLILAALALVLGISQCKKQEEPAASGEKQHIVLNASFGDSNAKIADPGNGELIWSLKDNIKVYNGSGTEIGTLECTDAANGTFEGDITASEGQITFTFGTKPDNYTNQTGNLEDAIYLESDKIDYRADGNYGEVKMNMPHAVLKLDVSALGSSGELEINRVDETVGETLVASVTDVSTLAAVFVAVPTDGNEKVYKISIGDKTAVKAWTLLPNTFYTKSNGTGGGTGDAIVIEPVGGKIINFSINDDYETNDNLEFNFTIEPNAGCVLNNDPCLCLSLYNSSPEIDNCDQIIVCQYPYNTGSISKDEIKSLDYESGEPIYIRLWVEFKDSDGFCGEPVYVYSDVIEASFTFVEEE